VESLDKLWTLLSTPVLGGLYPLKTMLGLLLFYGAIMLARRARRWIATLVDQRPADQQARLKRWVYRSTLGFGSVVAFGVAGVPVQDILGRRLTTLGETELTLMTLLTAGLITWLCWWFSQLVQEAVRGSFSKRGVTEEGTLDAVNRLVHYAVMAVGLGVALQTMGVNLGALFAAGAVFAVGVGFALQDIVQNFVSGLILLVERSITTRDVLEVEGRVVIVEAIGIRSTVVRTQDEEQLIVPNSALVQNPVKNLTLKDSLARIRTSVGVHYDSDMERVAEILEQAARQVPGQTGAQDPRILLLEFGDSSVVWEVSVWTHQPWEVPRTRSELNRAIWRTLKQSDITIAYPQLEVHLSREDTP
jgi:potassium-dependent mechanosensitive channel